MASLFDKLVVYVILVLVLLLLVLLLLWHVVNIGKEELVMLVRLIGSVGHGMRVVLGVEVGVDLLVEVVDESGLLGEPELEEDELLLVLLVELVYLSRMVLLLLLHQMNLLDTLLQLLTLTLLHRLLTLNSLHPPFQLLHPSRKLTIANTSNLPTQY